MTESRKSTASQTDAFRGESSPRFYLTRRHDAVGFDPEPFHAPLKEGEPLEAVEWAREGDGDHVWVRPVASEWVRLDRSAEDDIVTAEAYTALQSEAA
jgi:hypothetical protein